MKTSDLRNNKNTTLEQVAKFIIKTVEDNQRLNPGNSVILLQDIEGILKNAPYFQSEQKKLREEIEADVLADCAEQHKKLLQGLLDKMPTGTLHCKDLDVAWCEDCLVQWRAEVKALIKEQMEGM